MNSQEVGGLLVVVMVIGIGVLTMFAILMPIFVWRIHVNVKAIKHSFDNVNKFIKIKGKEL